MTWSLALIIGAIVCMVVGALVILSWIWRGLQRFLRKPTTSEMRDYTGTH